MKLFSSKEVARLPLLNYLFQNLLLSEERRCKVEDKPGSIFLFYDHFKLGYQGVLRLTWCINYNGLEKDIPK